eukprot:281890_1
MESITTTRDLWNCIIMYYVFVNRVHVHKNNKVIIDNVIVLFYYLFGNLAIQCQNQLRDEQSDKVNKPYLPLAAGLITRNQLKIVSIIMYVLYGSMTLFYYGITSAHGKCGLIAIILSTMYSLPPFDLKHIPFINSGVIIICRPLIYHHLLMDSFLVFNTNYVYVEYLNAFYWMQFWNIISVCLYKDVPDIDGDKKVDHITTLPMIVGTHLTFTFVLISQVMSLWISQMPLSFIIVLFIVFVPYYTQQHFQQSYAT